MKIDVEDIKKIDVKPGQALVVFVDTHAMNPAKANKALDNAKKVMRQVFPDEQIKIIAASAGQCSFAIIDSISHVDQQLEADTDNAYDRAMRGLC